MCGNTVMAAFV